MHGTEKQIVYASQVRSEVVAKWHTAADRLQAAMDAGMEPAIVPIVSDIIAYVRGVAGEIEASDDAAFILDRHYTSPAQWRNILVQGDWRARLKAALGNRDGALMVDDLHQIIATGSIQF